jgi:hypothetical protein
MQDLFQNYVSDLNKLRDAFHNELTATAEDLSKAMGLYARRSEAALASFMEKVSTRGIEFEASAMARLNQFRGLPATDGLPEVDGGLPTPIPTNPDQLRVAVAAERAVADGLHVESDGDRKPPPARPIALVKSGPVQSEPAA